MGGLALAMWAYSQESGAHTAFAMYGPPPRSPQLANFGGSPPPHAGLLLGGPMTEEPRCWDGSTEKKSTGVPT